MIWPNVGHIAIYGCSKEEWYGPTPEDLRQVFEVDTRGEAEEIVKQMREDKRLKVRCFSREIKVDSLRIVRHIVICRQRPAKE